MLELNLISKSFNSTKILDNLSVSFELGINGIAGANGCGKTTMLKIITGLSSPFTGEILYNSQMVNPGSKSWRSKIGYLPQSIGLYNRMTVYDLLDYMMVLSEIKNREFRKNRIEHISSELNLNKYLAIPCGHLSGGVKQRVGIAQAFIHDPEVVLLDEPTNNLDVEERERLHVFLDKVKQNKIILYVGHIIEELGYICNKLIILKDGKLGFQGAPFDLLNHSKYFIKQQLINKNEPHRFQSANILRKMTVGEKLKIVYLANDSDSVGEPAEAHFEDIYKIITRDKELYV